MASDPGITRRTMLAHTARAAGAAAVASGLRSAMAQQTPSLEKLGGVWDMHGHLSGGVTGTPTERMATLLAYAQRMGIERLIVYMGYPFAADPSPEEVRRQNDQVLEALAYAPDRVLGFVYLNPKYVKESLAELDRCVARGPMVGVKLWVAVRCHERCLDSIMERATELKAPILQHTWSKATGNLAGESVPEDLSRLAARHPRTSFIAAHTGGEWESGIRAIRAAGNVTAEICGSDPAAGMVEMAVRELGPQRVMYGSDFGGRSFASQLAKVYGADVPDEAKRLILSGNIKRMLQPILTAKGVRT